MTDVYDAIDPGFYDNIYHNKTGLQSKWHNLKFNVLQNLLIEEDVSNLLDIACGPGTFIGNLPSQINCIGVDIAKKQISYAQNKYGNEHKKFLTCDVLTNKIPFPDNTFDAVSSIEFFEHINVDSIKKILQEAYRCLKPGGLFVATTPNYELLWKFLEYSISKIGKIDYRSQHITRFTLPTFCSLIEESGLEIVTARKYLYLSPFISLISWDLSSKLFDFEYSYLKTKGNLLLVVARKVIS